MQLRPPANHIMLSRSFMQSPACEPHSLGPRSPRFVRDPKLYHPPDRRQALELSADQWVTFVFPASVKHREYELILFRVHK